MTQEQSAKLERLKYRATRYELVAENNGRRVLAGYTARRGRRGLLAMIQHNGEDWLKFTGADQISFGARVADGATIGAWSIRFSGRTQRDAILEGELPFFAN